MKLRAADARRILSFCLDRPFDVELSDQGPCPCIRISPLGRGRGTGARVRGRDLRRGAAGGGRGGAGAQGVHRAADRLLRPARRAHLRRQAGPVERPRLPAGPRARPRRAARARAIAGPLPRPGRVPLPDSAASSASPSGPPARPGWSPRSTSSCWPSTACRPASAPSWPPWPSACASSPRPARTWPTSCSTRPCSAGPPTPPTAAKSCSPSPTPARPSCAPSPRLHRNQVLAVGPTFVHALGAILSSFEEPDAPSSRNKAARLPQPDLTPHPHPELGLLPLGPGCRTSPSPADGGARSRARDQACRAGSLTLFPPRRSALSPPLPRVTNEPPDNSGPPPAARALRPPARWRGSRC